MVINISSTIVFITVIPLIETSPQSQNLIAGGSFSLICLATGYPVPDITWTEDGTSFFMDNRRVVSTIEGLRSSGSVLTIANAVVSDSGLYQCVANNVLDTDTADAEVIVRG